MKALNFVTPGLIDLDMVFTFGVNAKVTDNPIGYFGTGLKYALATLLRAEHKIYIHRMHEHFEVTARTAVFREKEFHKVFLGERDLGFTTDLGKTWEPWMAYRELESNTRDEEGFTTFDIEELRAAMAQGNVSIISVHGEGIVSAWHDREQIFCPRDPIAATKNIEVMPRASQWVYYRGVRAFRLPKTAKYTYNILEQSAITEDRFLLEGNIDWRLGKLLAELKDSRLLRNILTQPDAIYEASLDFHPSTPSPEFFEAFNAVQRVATCNPTARALAAAVNKYSAEILKLDPIQQAQLDRAIEFLMQIGVDARKYEIKLAKLQGAMGQAKDGVIMISPQAFRMGTKYVAGTIYEEYVHLNEGLYDHTREMQNFLVDTIMTMAERLIGQPI